jgi:GT2 family glycosyltransferase
MNQLATKPPGPYPLHVVVLNWNLPGDTFECVASVQTPAHPGVQIVLIDNGSTDGSVERFRARFGDTLTILANQENLGFAGGVNTGIRWALANGAAAVLLLNNDTVVAADMIPHLAAAAAQSSGAGVVGPAIYYYDLPQRIWRFADREVPWLPVARRLPDRAVAEAGATPFRVDYVTACGMLVRRQVFEAIGLFDERYFMYFEDADFCRRARQAGFEIWCAPRARMWHNVSLSAQKAKPATRYAESWGRAQFYRDHPHGPSRALTVSYLLARALKVTLRDALSGDWGLVKPLWQGTLDGQRDRPSRMSDFVAQ